MAFKFLILVAIVAVAQAGVLRSDILAPTLAIDHASAHLGEAHYVPSAGSNPAYEFKYGVHDSYTGDSKSAHEIRNGDFVQGTYSLNDADGTRRTVDYTATPFTGFEATVSKEPIVGATVFPAHEPIIAHEPILARSFVEPVATGHIVDYKTGPAFLGTPTVFPGAAPPTVINPHSFTRLALPATNLVHSNLHLGSDLRLAPLAPGLRYATEGLPIGLHEPVHRFGVGYLPERRYAAEGLPIAAAPYHRYAAEGLPIAIPEPVHFARHDAGLTGEVLDGFAAGVRSYTASAPTLLRSW